MARPVRRRSNKKKKNKNPNKTSTPVPGAAPSAGSKVPRSMVFSRGNIGRTLHRLEVDLRRMCMPFTATSLKESKRNTLKDFLQVAGPLGVTHFVVLSSSSLAPYLRVSRTPRGPTLTFKISQYSLAADVANAQAKPRVPPGIFETPPLLVMQGFGAGLAAQQQHMKLVSIMFQNMFPAIDVSTVKLTECRRVVLLSYDPGNGTIELRQYSVRAKPVGVSRSIRKLVQSHQVPNLSGFADISEFIMRGGYGSESEAEDEASQVRLPQDIGRANRAAHQSAVQLHELGPRLTLDLVKVEEGLMGGEVMFHKFIKKTAEEVKAQRLDREQKLELKRKRRQQQEENVRKKEMAKQPASGRKRKAGPQEEQGGKEVAEQDAEDGNPESTVAGNSNGAGSDDDDADWYRKEVGQEPDAQGAWPKRPRGPGQRGRGMNKRTLHKQRR